MGFFDSVGRAAAAIGTGGASELFGRRSSGGGSGPALPAIPKFAMRKTDEFIKDDPSVQIGNSAMQKRFDTIRNRVSQDANAAGDKNIGAIQRKFASMGATGSGAQIRLEQQAGDQVQRQKADAMAQVDAAEQEQMANRELAQADMDFKQRVFNFDRGSKMHELDLAERQQQQDAVATEINATVAKEQMRPPKQGLISGLLDGLL